MVFLSGTCYLLTHRDTKFCEAFRAILEREGIRCLRLPPRSPNLTLHIERFLRSLKEDRLHRMIILRTYRRACGAHGKPPDLVDLAQLRAGEVHHLLIIKAFSDRIDLVGTISRLFPSEADADTRTLTLALVEDALSGCHPLYRIPRLLQEKDGTRTPRQMRYGVSQSLRERTHAIETARQEAGC